MAKVKGEAVILYIKDLDNTEVPIGCARSITYDISQELIETSSFQQTRYRTYIPAGITWGGSVEGLVFITKDLDSVFDMGRMYEFIDNPSICKLRWYETDETGVHFLQKEGEAWIESINETASFDNMATFTINFRGTGIILFSYGEI